MPGVLDAAGATPPAPRPDQVSAPSTGGVLSAPSMSGAPMVPGQAPAGQAPQVPAPTHGQTVAALRHFDAIEAELTVLLKDSAIGKSNVKSKIIDGVTKLVADRILTPSNAVSQLATVPDEPFQQRKWLQQHLIQAVVAKVKVLSDHAKAFGGTPEHMIDKTSDPDNHIADMQGVMGHYGGVRGQS